MEAVVDRLVTDLDRVGAGGKVRDCRAGLSREGDIPGSQLSRSAWSGPGQCLAKRAPPSRAGGEKNDSNAMRHVPSYVLVRLTVLDSHNALTEERQGRAHQGCSAVLRAREQGARRSHRVDRGRDRPPSGRALTVEGNPGRKPKGHHRRGGDGGERRRGDQSPLVPETSSARRAARGSTPDGDGRRRRRSAVITDRSFRTLLEHLRRSRRLGAERPRRAALPGRRSGSASAPKRLPSVATIFSRNTAASSSVSVPARNSTRNAIGSRPSPTCSPR